MRNLSFFIFIAVIFLNCNKDHTAKTPASPDDIFYFRGTVNGSPVDWVTKYPDSNSPEIGTFPSQGETIYSQDCSNTYCKAIDEGTAVHTEKVVDNQERNSILVYFTQAARVPDYTEIKTWFTPGMRPFGFLRRDVNNPVHDGVIIEYIDANKLWWGSSIEFVDQSASTFESLELKDAAPDKPYLKIWTARFSCNLFRHISCVPGAPVDKITISGEICCPVFAKSN